jgi:hypothetical protein
MSYDSAGDLSVLRSWRIVTDVVLHETDSAMLGDCGEVAIVM